MTSAPRSTLFVLAALIASISGCSPEDAACRCRGDLPEGRIDGLCGQTVCVGSARYTCSGPDEVIALGPCEGEDAGAPPPDRDAGTVPPVDAARPLPDGGPLCVLSPAPPAADELLETCSVDLAACWSRARTQSDVDACFAREDAACGECVDDQLLHCAITRGDCAPSAADFECCIQAACPSLDQACVDRARVGPCDGVTDAFFACLRAAIDGDTCAYPDPACVRGPETECGDGSDDDSDGSIDCADGDCARSSRCDPCAARPCRDANRGVCTEGGTPEAPIAVCSCDPGFSEDAMGVCRDATPCSPSPCTGANRECVADGLVASCVCRAGYAEDASGACRDATPCTPSPCTGSRTFCTERGFDAECSCAPGQLVVGDRCVSTCPGGSHLDGDALEPNECAAQAYPLTASPAGTRILRYDAAITPTDADVDFYRTGGRVGSLYWVLVDASAAMCALDPRLRALDAASGWPTGLGWTYGAQLPGTSSPITFSCARAAGQPSGVRYGLGALEFDVSEGDYPDTTISPPLVTDRSMSDLFSSAGDGDAFAFETDLPIRISHVGHSAFLDIDVFDAGDGARLTSLQTECSSSLSARDCAAITGSGRVRIVVRAAPTGSLVGLTAYRLAW